MPFRTIRSRLRLAAAGIAVILIAAGTFGWWTVHRLAVGIERSVSEAARVQSLTARFTFDVVDVLRAGEDYLIRPDSANARRFVEHGRDAHRIQAILVKSQLARIAHDSTSEAEQIGRASCRERV